MTNTYCVDYACLIFVGFGLFFTVWITACLLYSECISCSWLYNLLLLLGFTALLLQHLCLTITDLVYLLLTWINFNLICSIISDLASNLVQFFTVLQIFVPTPVAMPHDPYRHLNLTSETIQAASYATRSRLGKMIPIVTRNQYATTKK